ncbi:hypothetical protein TNCV_2148241 [Trichonephila clavipes]|uniref:Uncharacterized protein n=1 Tax=Trichonephila clavipes TaxID=2585209 RepID=A0A8X6SXT4_TRICX|nr:hypothetical protein TNCV_2148241 [Trichonephila clavipes]
MNDACAKHLRRKQQQTGVAEVMKEQITMASRCVLITLSPMEVRAVIRYEPLRLWCPSFINTYRPCMEKRSCLVKWLAAGVAC